MTFAGRQAGHHGASFALALLTAVSLCAGVARGGPRNIKRGESVGEFKLNDTEGNVVDTARWRGKPGVWLFASARQKSSEAAVRDLQTALDGLVGYDVQAAVLTSDVLQVAYYQQFSTQHRIRIPVVLDAQRAVYGRIGVIVLPTTLLIDKRGKLHEALSGHNLSYRRHLSAHLAFLAGKITQDELKRELTLSGPTRDVTQERVKRLCRSAEIMLRRGLVAEAEVELRRAIEVAPDCGDGYLALADLRARGGQFAEAEKLVREAQKRDPPNHRAKLTLGVIRFRQKRLDEAERQLREALVFYPDPTRTHYWLGRVHEERGEHRKAAVHFRAAVERLLPGVSAEK